MSISNYISKKVILLIILCNFLLTSCLDGGPKENVGSIFGGVTGAVIGSHFGGGTGSLVGVGLGALAGSMIGGSIGKQMDDSDKKRHNFAFQSSLDSQPDGVSTAWVNPNNGHRGYVVATTTYKKPSGQYCREFQQKVTIAGQDQAAYGTACRQPDGSWKVISEN